MFLTSDLQYRLLAQLCREQSTLRDTTCDGERGRTLCLERACRMLQRRCWIPRIGSALRAHAAPPAVDAALERCGDVPYADGDAWGGDEKGTTRAGDGRGTADRFRERQHLIARKETTLSGMPRVLRHLSAPATRSCGRTTSKSGALLP